MKPQILKQQAQEELASAQRSVFFQAVASIANPRTHELAANLKQLELFIKVLYAAAASISSDQTSPKIAAAVSGWAAGAKPAAKLLDTDILPMLVNIAKNGEDAHDDEELTIAARQLRRNVATALKRDKTVRYEDLDMLNSLSTYLLNRSDAALNKAVRLLPSLEDPELTSAFVKKANSQSTFVKPLQKIVQAVTKEKGRSILTAEEGKILKAKNPQVYKEYLRLRKDYNQVWKDELRNLVFKSKKPLVDFGTAFKYLRSKGVQNPLPVGYEGQVDANGALYTKAGKKIQGLPGPGFSIEMNPNYNPKTDDEFVFTTVNDKTGKRAGHVYTEEYRQRANKEKFQKVDSLDKDIDKIRKKWVALMRRQDDSAACVAATILECMYQFSARIGNTSADRQTFGISTLLAKHCKVNGDKITISYPGKDGVKQIHKLQATTAEGKILVKNIERCLVDKKPKDRLFTAVSSSGREIPITSNMVNRLFQQLGAKTTVHKLRHVRGTRLFNQLVEANKDKIFNTKKPLTEAQAISIFKKIATKVGELLGHVRGVGENQKVTPATAVKNYISPGAMLQFFNDLGQRPPKILQGLSAT